MARPRKMNTEDMLTVVNSIYEEYGDPVKLKCSFLADYAATQGFNVKAYDFRRNPAVRGRINELNDLTPFYEDGKAFAYKGLDVDAFIARNKSPSSLKNALLDLDSTWRKVYDRAILISKEKEKLIQELRQKTIDYKQLENKLSELEVQSAEFRAKQKEMLLKNRYLTGSVKKYLYPAIANEILKSEGVLEYIDTEIPPSTLDTLVESETMIPFSKSIEADRRMLSFITSPYDEQHKEWDICEVNAQPIKETREETLLRMMAVNIGSVKPPMKIRD
ncbi:MAG: hypothetical protein LBU94_00320 [Clostridiales bacterium]|nr:hypothetical protein [Clostridiales bacterium]